MFQYDSQTWTPKTTAEHSVDILTDVNNLRKAGGFSVVVAIAKNIIWLIILAVANIRSILDTLLYKAQTSLDIALCDDVQVPNLVTIAGTEFAIGTRSVVTLTVTAKPDGNCVVPIKTRLLFSNRIYFETDEELTVGAGESATVSATCTVVGNITVAAGTLTTFEETVDGVASVTNSISTNGKDTETVTEIRQRILVGNTITQKLDVVKRDLSLLQGVNDANVYFNDDPVNNLTLPGDVIVPPRQAVIIIDGNSTYLANKTTIAETYIKRMLAKTNGDNSQVYTTLSNQEFVVKFYYCATQDVYLNVYVENGSSLTDNEKSIIKQTLIVFNPKVGQKLTDSIMSAQVKDSLISQGLSILAEKVIGVGLAFEEDLPDYSNIVYIDANKKANIVADNIEVTEVS